MEFPPLDLRPVVTEQHHTEFPIDRDELEDFLKDEKVTEVEPIYWVHDDGTKQLVALAVGGDGETIAETLDLDLADEATPRVQALVEAAVMNRVADVMAEGFRLGVEFAQSGKINGINMIEELRQSA